MRDLCWREDHIGQAVEQAHTVLSLFLERMSAAIRELSEEHEIRSARHMEATLRLGGEEALEQAIDDMSEVASLLYDDFPRHLYASVVIAWYSCLETQLDRICRREQRLRNLRRAPEDIGGTGIARSYKYLTEVVGLTPSVMLDDLWKELDGLRRIRNVIVHREGRFKTMVRKGRLEGNPEKEIRPYLERHKDVLTVGPFGILELSRGYCELVLGQGLNFVKLLLYELGRTESPDNFRVVS